VASIRFLWRHFGRLLMVLCCRALRRRLNAVRPVPGDLPRLPADVAERLRQIRVRSVVTKKICS